MIAVKFWYQAPSNPSQAPAAWPWIKVTIAENLKEAYEDQGYTVYSETDFVNYLAVHNQDYENWKNANDESLSANALKVTPLCEEEFRNYHPSKIDFRRHLKSNIQLNKVTTMLRNGRPDKAEYFLGEEKIAEIKFVFEVDAFNFMTRRKENLGYVCADGTIKNYYTIHEQIYNPNNPSHMSERIKERKDGRANIFDEIKAKLDMFLANAYMQQGMSYADILTIAGNFWGTYSSKIDSWINTGTPAFKNQIMADTEFPFLDWIMPASFTGEDFDKPMREYIRDRITY